MLEPNGLPSQSLSWFPEHEVSITRSVTTCTSPGWDASPFQGYPPPPAFYQASLTTCWYPLRLLAGEGHCESKVFSQKRPFSWTLTCCPKSSAMINTPPCFSQWLWWGGKWWQHQYHDVNLSHTLHGWGSTPYISRALTLSRKFFSATAGTWPLWEKKRWHLIN